MSRIRLIKGFALVFFVAIFSVPSVQAQTSKLRYKAVAFDYFVIFDPNSVVTEVEKVFPGKGMDVTKAWRAKQFEYGFLRSITKNHEDFFKVTEDALFYTIASMKLEATKDQKKQLLNAYLSLKPWPDSIDIITNLKNTFSRYSLLILLVTFIKNFPYRYAPIFRKNPGRLGTRTLTAAHSKAPFPKRGCGGVRRLD